MWLHVISRDENFKYERLLEQDRSPCKFLFAIVTRKKFDKTTMDGSFNSNGKYIYRMIEGESI